MARERRLLDEYLPVFDVVERHRIDVPCPPQRVWDTFERTDFATSATIRWLFRMRGMAARDGLPLPLTLATLERWRFATLERRSPSHLVMGLVGRFWTPTGGLLRIDRAAFDVPRPGYARAAWSFELEPLGDGCRLATETRVATEDERTRRAFRRYWRLVGPFSALIRRRVLNRVRRVAPGAAAGRVVSDL